MEKQTQISYTLAGLYVILKILRAPGVNILDPKDYNLANFVGLASTVLLALFIISVFYNVITYIKKDKPKDLWKLGWLGFVGLLGLFIAPGLSVLSPFLGFFGLMRK